jgi:adenylosuccinate synthase
MGRWRPPGGEGGDVSALVVVGAQWGDEAKGKIVDLLAQDADLVVRYGGGSNAGHTVTVGELQVKLHLVPSGILNPHARCVVTDGVVIDPAVLLGEIDELRSHGIDVRRLRISPHAHAVMPYHQEIDRLEDERRGEGRLGTTMQGVGPAYEDRARRCGIRIADLVDAGRLAARLDTVLPDKNFLLRKLYRAPAIPRARILLAYASYGERLRPFVSDTASIVQDAIAAGQGVLFEGAQGTMLDLDHGNYPFVTSSHPVAGGACIGTGIGPRAIDAVVGVVKSYTTRVGEGVFPTEIVGDLAGRIRERGGEYGTTTGRPRRIGWLDAVCLRYASRINGLSAMAITLLDVLSGLPEIRICTGYRIGAENVTELHGGPERLATAQPIYQTMPGWEQDLAAATRWEHLPRRAQAYVRRIEELTGVPVAIVSVGPRRDQTVTLNPNLLGAGRRPARAA